MTGKTISELHEGDRADLTRLPLIQCWPFDGDLNSGQVYPHAVAERSAAADRASDRYRHHTRNRSAAALRSATA